MGGLIKSHDDSNSLNIEIGKVAPDFTLMDNDGNRWQLSDQRGKVTALLFYPKNETMVCTRQLCSVRDCWEDYLQTKAAIVGVSPGSIESHSDFSQKYKLPLPLLADDTREVTKYFCRHWWMPVSFVRAIIVVDAKGIVRSNKMMFRGFRPTNNSVIRDIYAARTDALQDKFEDLIERHQATQAERFPFNN